MAYTSTGISNAAVISIPAAASLTGSPETDIRGKAIKFDGSGAAVLASADGEKVMGIALITEAPRIGDNGKDVNVQVKDIGLAKVSEAVVAGDELMAGTDGKLKKATAGKFVIATALEPFTSGEKLIQVQITKYVKENA